MRRFERLTGRAIPLGLKNIDTDVILPGRYLKTVTRSGLGAVAFQALRGDPDNLFDQPRYRGAPILIAGNNFGCGSSREHALWALGDLGIRAIIAPSFADIFSANAFKNGLLLVPLPQSAVDLLLEAAPTEELAIDLQRQLVAIPSGVVFEFDIDPFRRMCLLEGLDEIDLTEKLIVRISAYEDDRRRSRPWLAEAVCRRS